MSCSTGAPRARLERVRASDSAPGCDENIYRHTQRFNAHQPQALPVTLSIRQLVLTEIYPDRYFRDPDALMRPACTEQGRNDGIWRRPYRVTAY